MKLTPSLSLSRRETTRGLDLVIKEGLTAEAMSTLTGGTFLMAMALLLSATNFQIGLLAALPTMTNAFQILTIWILKKYNNRRVIAVISNGLARLPLLLIGLLPLIFSTSTSTATIIFILFFHYFFGSMAGASWNSWMKDLVPEKKLGSYFSRRTKMTQTLNVCLSLALALALDHIKKTHPQFELSVYALMFVIGGSLGLLGTWLLSRTPEPVSYLPKESLLKLYKKPLSDKNFRSFLLFQSAWTFALNIATPFFTVFMLRSLQLQLSTIIVVGLCSQIAGILAIKLWGQYADQFSNKTIIRIAAPIYICCILMWPVASMSSNILITVLIVAGINILSGISSSGVNLSISNIAMKLAPKSEAVVYLSARSMIVALTGAISPILGGSLADFLSGKSILWKINLRGFAGINSFKVIELHNFGFLFLIGGVLAFGALRILKLVKEEGETAKEKAVSIIRTGIRYKVKQGLQPQEILSTLHAIYEARLQFHRRMKTRFGNKLFSIHRTNARLLHS